MYEDGEKAKRAIRAGIENLDDMSNGGGGGRSIFGIDDEDDNDNDKSRVPSIPTEVRVVSFDLDNTLWKTGPTIAQANDALAAFLDTHNIVQPERVEVVMGKLFQQDKTRYCPIEKDNAKSPVNLTLLRKDAMASIFAEHNKGTVSDPQGLAEEAFAVWADARHNTIPSYFSTQVIDTLQTIRSTLVSSTGKPVLVCAITDGNSNPTVVPGLDGLFDFCVNAEQVGISKPNRLVYTTALREAALQDCLNDLLAPDMTDDALEDGLGRWWVHIGDDFTKDIVAAKDLGMRTIWARELVTDKATKGTDEGATAKEKQPSKSLEEFQKGIADKTVLKMTVGADDYLADSILAEFVDAEAFRFDEIATILSDWHQQGIERNTGSVQELEDSTKVELPTMDVENPAPTSAPAQPQADTKFCMACGTKLPVEAKFCVSCGAKQP